MFVVQDEFIGDDVDLYDDVIAAPSSEPHDRSDNATPALQIDRVDSNDTNGTGHSYNLAPNHIGRRHQLYVGNLTWVSSFFWSRNGKSLLIEHHFCVVCFDFSGQPTKTLQTHVMILA